MPAASGNYCSRKHLPSADVPVTLCFVTDSPHCSQPRHESAPCLSSSPSPRVFETMALRAPYVRLRWKIPTPHRLKTLRDARLVSRDSHARPFEGYFKSSHKPRDCTPRFNLDYSHGCDHVARAFKICTFPISCSPFASLHCAGHDLSSVPYTQSTLRPSHHARLVALFQLIF